jgi:hypothetical protein
MAVHLSSWLYASTAARGDGYQCLRECGAGPAHGAVR